MRKIIYIIAITLLLSSCELTKSGTYTVKDVKFDKNHQTLTKLKGMIGYYQLQPNDTPKIGAKIHITIKVVK